MTSKRFPGKSTAILNNRPVIEHVIKRCNLVTKTDKVILAVPDSPLSEPMLKISDTNFIWNFLGSEDNVLDRFYHAAMYHKLDIIVRITGDCPFIIPQLIDECIELLMWRKLDYVSNCFPIRTYPKGLDCEVFTMDCLEAAHILATSHYDREHVTPFMQRSIEIKKGTLSQKVDDSELNLCVDVPEDIPRIEEHIKAMKRKMQ